MKINEDNLLDKARELDRSISQSVKYLTLRESEANFHYNNKAINCSKR